MVAANRSILRGAFILSAAGIICKVLGAAYRIPLVRLIGDEGIGLYQMAYPIYLVFMALSTAGMPLAISSLVAERAALHDYLGMKRVLWLAFGTLGGLGALGGSVMALGARFFANHVAADPRAYPVILALAPAVPLMALMAALRGYFQGWQDMLPSALSQLIEQVIRVATLLILAVLLLPRGVEHAATGAAFGAAAGGLAGLFWLIRCYLRRPLPVGRGGPAAPLGYWRGCWRLLRLSAPIAVGALLLPLMQAIDSIAVPTRLQAIGYDVSRATAALGQLGNAWAVIYVPITFTAALATSLVPAVAATWIRQERPLAAARIGQALRTAVLLCLPAATGLSLMARDICLVLYGTASAAELLAVLAPAAFFLGLQGVCAGALQGLGRTVIPVRNFALGFLLKLCLTGILCSNPVLGPKGAGLSTVLGAALAACLSLIALGRRVGLPASLRGAFLKGGLATALMVLAINCAGCLLPANPFLRLSLLLPLGLAVFSGGLWLFGGVEAKDVEVIRGLGMH